MESYDFPVELKTAFAAKLAAGAKFVDADVTPSRAAAAREYCRLYAGNFGYIVDMRFKMFGGKPLSTAQTRGVLNVMLAEHRRNTETAMTVISNPKLADIPARLARARDRGLKFPKIVFEAGGERFAIRLKGPKAKVPGSAEVGSRSRYFNERFGCEMPIWYATISPEGAVVVGRKMTAALMDALKLLNDDPAKFAKMQGTLMSACCFCGRDLVTKESVVAGYGPVCAEKYGLPWGGDGTDEAYAAIKEGVAA